jgi:hypothetical protein
MPGARWHPQPRVRMKRGHERSHHRSTGYTRHSRTRLVLTVSSVLSPETWLCCLRHRRDARHRRQLDTCLGVSGPHGFAVRLKLIRLLSQGVLRIPRPTFRDDGEAPLGRGAGRGGLVVMICPTGKVKSFCRGDWTGQISLKLQGKFDFWSRLMEMPP